MNAQGLLWTMAAISMGFVSEAYAEQPPPPCHPNPHAAADRDAVEDRGDIENLPQPLKDRLIRLADRPHTALPLQAYAEADKPSQLFQYYLLDTENFEPNVFTTIIKGVNDTAQLSATGGDCGLPTVGAVRVPNKSDHFPDKQSNVVPIHESMGAYNSFQQSDAHSYWEFNYLGTNWIHPLYELPFTGGFPDDFGRPPDTFQDGEIGKLQSIVPGSGPRGINNEANVVGDNPTLPRDPDKFDADVDAQRESRQRGIPSGLANEIFLDVYERPVSFEPGVKNLQRRLFDAYAAEVARVDQNHDGIISAAEGDIDTASDGFADNSRLFLPATAFNRFAVTREINDGLLAPRFAPSQRAWVLSGTRISVSPAAPASAGRDADDR